jgi:hypothetical protein
LKRKANYLTLKGLQRQLRIKEESRLRDKLEDKAEMNKSAHVVEIDNKKGRKKNPNMKLVVLAKLVQRKRTTSRRRSLVIIARSLGTSSRTVEFRRRKNKPTMLKKTLLLLFLK